MFKLPIRIFAVVFCLSFSPAQPANASDTPTPDIVAGQKLATQLCARCHSIDKTSQSRFKPAPPFRSFSSKWPLESLEEALAEGITVGHPAMPEFQFKAGQITDLLGYIATLSPK